MPITLYLELVVNGLPTGEVLPVQQQRGHFEVDGEALRRLHVRHDAPLGSKVAVDTLPGVQAEYDGLNQRLLLTVPPEWLPRQYLEGAQPRARVEPAGGSGLLLSYDLYSTASRDASTSSLWSEQRWFSPLGTLSNTGIQRWGNGTAALGGSRYTRYDTRFTSTDLDSATERSWGDVVTGSLSWTRAVRLGGLQLSRNFGTRPDLVTYPLPAFAGQAAVPSAVELFVNGYRAASRNVQPGPFTLGELPTVSGAGAATLVTTDALGRQVLTTLPFYVSSQLLRPGLTDYSLAVGALRRDYGLRSFSYGRLAGTGVYRSGLSDTLTLEAQAQAGRGLAEGGLGAVVRLGFLGTVNGALSYGRVDGRGGWQYAAGYQYNAQRLSFGIQRLQRTADYGDISTFANDGFQLQRQSTQLNASYTTAAGHSLTLGVVSLQDFAGVNTRVGYASYGFQLRNDLYVSAVASRTVETRDTQLRLQLTYTLGPRTSAQFAGVDGTSTHRALASYQQSVPTEGGFGWNVAGSVGRGEDAYRQVGAQYRGSAALVQGGIYGSGNQLSRWFGASGSLGVMDGHFFAANRVTDSFALVSTQGVGGVGVLFDNQRVGRTDAAGYLLVPQVPAYRPSRYELDLLAMPPQMQAAAAERRVAVRAGAGALVELPVETLVAATLTLLTEDGQPMPVGSSVRHLETGLTTVVGWDGMVYLDRLRPSNRLLVQPVGGRLCTAAFDLDPAAGVLPHLPPLRCVPVPPGEAAAAAAAGPVPAPAPTPDAAPAAPVPVPAPVEDAPEPEPADRPTVPPPLPFLPPRPPAAAPAP